MSTNAAQEAENLEIEQVEARINADRNLNKNRRYVGTKETLAYIIYDISASFNISKYNDVFITDIVQIGLRFQTIVTFVIGIWDVINDIFLPQSLTGPEHVSENSSLSSFCTQVRACF